MLRRAFPSALIALALTAGASAALAARPGPASASAPVGQTASKPVPAPARFIDINSASRAELKTLPGVGDAEAQKIIATRPYLSKADLATKNVLPTGVYMSLKGPHHRQAESKTAAQRRAAMNIKPVGAALLLLAGWAWQAQAVAQATPPEAAASALQNAGAGTEYSEKGADTCLECHDSEADTTTFTTAGVFKNKHAHRGNARAPFGAGGLQCEACHGPGARHSGKGSKKTLTINSFKANSYLSVPERNKPCLGCHQDRNRVGWHAGAHERNNLACTDCHKLHAQQDPALAKASQSEVCYTCHKQQRADFHKNSTHPVRFGRMTCSDCHNPHGSTNPALLIKASVNQTCFSCHADKRGPLLWEHAPVAEDCTICHASHGSVRAALLTKSPPLLCQQCHSSAGHPAVARTGNALPGGSAGASVFLLAGGCTNCHSQVHGSNHPAGARLMR